MSGGRPSRISDGALVTRVVEAVAQGCTYEAACAAGPISVRTFYDWMGRGERDRLTEPEGRSPYVEFAERVDAANLEAERRITEAWVAAIPSDWRAARDFLERRFPSRWRRPQADLTRGGITGGYSPPDNFMSDDERAEALCVAIEQFIAQNRAEASEGTTQPQ